MKRWLDPTVCAFLINPIVATNPLFTQMTTRRYRNVKGGRVRVESKEEYKARTRMGSPDEFDVATMLVEWCRHRGEKLPGMQEKKIESEKQEDKPSDNFNSAEDSEPLDGAKFVSNSLDQE